MKNAKAVTVTEKRTGLGPAVRRVNRSIVGQFGMEERESWAVRVLRVAAATGSHAYTAIHNL
jgi:hypothetical protein